MLFTAILLICQQHLSCSLRVKVRSWMVSRFGWRNASLKILSQGVAGCVFKGGSEAKRRAGSISLLRCGQGGKGNVSAAAFLFVLFCNKFRAAGVCISKTLAV